MLSASDKRHLFYLGIPIKRVGECDRCNGHPWCCTEMNSMEIESKSFDEESAYYLKLRGVKLTGQVMAFDLKLPPCPQLLPDGRCRVYDKRPKICQNFPVHFTQIVARSLNNTGWLKVCSYDWDLNTDQEISVDPFRLTKVMAYE